MPGRATREGQQLVLWYCWCGIVLHCSLFVNSAFFGMSCAESWVLPRGERGRKETRHLERVAGLVTLSDSMRLIVGDS